MDENHLNRYIESRGGGASALVVNRESELLEQRGPCKRACKWPSRDKRALERISVHAVPVGGGGQAEGVVALLAAAAATEKTAGVAGDLVTGDGDVISCTPLVSCLFRL